MMSKEGHFSVAERGRRLVAAELAGRGLSLSPGPDRRRSSHMIVTDSFGASAPIVVRIVNGGGWQLDADRYLNLDIDAERRTQRVRGRRPIAGPDTPVIYVWLATDDEPNRYYILPKWMVQALVFRTHRWWLRHWGWTRPRRPASTHCTLWPKDLEAFEGDWDLIFERLAAQATTAAV
ncbi:MAG: hypothetical protein ACYTGG_07415 [Planctomycetota bacterium]|jgi:hypothetical protein